MTGGDEAGYRKVLAAFCRDARERFDWFKAFSGDQGPADIAGFTTRVHGLKSAAASIGAAALSTEAADLEAAGKAGNTALIRERLPAFFEGLGEMLQKMEQALGLAPPAADPFGPPAMAPPEPALSGELRPLFKALRNALEQMDVKTVDRLLVELEGKNPGARIKEALAAISSQVLITEFDAAAAAIDILLAPGTPGK
jgi:HPt (histidine-containing phosphotransfer) domain-containing protein